MPDHHCHATDCEAQVSRGQLFCGRHWWMVPPRLRARIWDAVWVAIRAVKEQEQRRHHGPQVQEAATATAATTQHSEEGHAQTGT